MKGFHIVIIIVSILTVVVLMQFIGTTHAGKVNTKKEIVSSSIVEPATEPTVATDTRDTLVYSFYDTQLQVVCYVASSGMWCTSVFRLSDRGQEFVKDRTSKAKEDLKAKIGKVGTATIIPRIISLDR